MASILIVDDEQTINDLILLNLQMAGYECNQAFDGKSAIEMLEHSTYDLALLDIMLPEIDGYELLPYFKKKGIPAIYLTAKDSVLDKVKGLRSGAEDYITKPFEAMELIARVELVLRRSGTNKMIFELGEICINLDERVVRKQGQIVELAAQEYALLEMLVKNCGLALSRERLLEGAWGYDYIGETRTVDMHIQRLRKKLGWDEEIRTIYKFGYRLER